MKVNIQPTVNMLQILRHVEYKPWYALAEYVDNSLQSFLDHRDALPKKLRVQVEISKPDKRIVIQDNAAGITRDDLERALRAADVPPNRSGLNEFGMGMKSASCWFSPDWTIATTCKGESVERSVRFDLDTIAETGQVELDVVEVPAREDTHYTIITLNGVKDIPQGRTLGKIREHLRDIYRLHLRDQQIELIVGGEELGYEDPEFLSSQPFGSDRRPVESEPPCIWRKDFIFSLSDGRVVEGQAGLLAKGNTKKAGLILFRRRRAIQGTGEDPYRPEDIFGRGNSYESQRIWGEVNLEDFEVSHTKDGIKWDGAEGEFVEKLLEEFDRKPISLIQQARNFRAKYVTNENDGVMEAGARVLDDLESSVAESGGDLDGIDLGSEVVENHDSLPAAPDFELMKREFVITLPESNEEWTVVVELSRKQADGLWMQYVGDYDPNQKKSSVHIRLLMNSPFMQKVVVPHDEDSLGPVVRIAAGLGLAERLAHQRSRPNDHSAIRRTLGGLLSGSLSRVDDEVKEVESA